MKLRTIGLSLFGSTSLIIVPLLTISCQKQILLEDAFKTKDLGHLTKLTRPTVKQKLFALNPELEVMKKELSTSVIRYNKAHFYIHPRYQKSSKYRGGLTVKLSSYIRPLFDDGEVIALTPQSPKYSVEFEISKDFPQEKFVINSSWNSDSFIEVSEGRTENIEGSEFRKFIIDLKLKFGVSETESVYFGFKVEDALLPDIDLKIN